MKQSSPRRPWLRPLIGALILFVVAGALMSCLILGRWTDLADSRKAEAERVFTHAITAAGGKKILCVDYPKWFVRLKTMSSFNLGTMISVVRKDWEHLDLSVSYEDLKRRGPALLLDHQLENGARIVLWTSRKNQRP